MHPQIQEAATYGIALSAPPPSLPTLLFVFFCTLLHICFVFHCFNCACLLSPSESESSSAVTIDKVLH